MIIIAENISKPEACCQRFSGDGGKVLHRIQMRVETDHAANRIEFLKDSRQGQMHHAELARRAAQTAVVFRQDVKYDAWAFT